MNIDQISSVLMENLIKFNWNETPPIPGFATLAQIMMQIVNRNHGFRYKHLSTTSIGRRTSRTGKTIVGKTIPHLL